MSIAPYKFISNNAPYNFNIVHKRDIEEFAMYIGRINNSPTTVIKLPKEAFHYHRKDGQPSNNNSTRVDIKWIIKDQFGIDIEFFDDGEDAYYVGWTTSAEPVRSSIYPPTLIKQSELITEPQVVWEWIKYVCSQNVSTQQSGGIRFNYSEWRRNITIDRISFG